MEALTIDKPDKIFKIVPHRKPKKIITPEEQLEQRTRNCINFLNKANGIIAVKPTLEEIKQKIDKQMIILGNYIKLLITPI
jgi:SpoU rRNA methylase family enzyme